MMAINSRKVISFYALVMLFIAAIAMKMYAQTEESITLFKNNLSETKFPDIDFADIPGAPQLTNPVLLTGFDMPIFSEGCGLAAPAFYDLDGDGLKDLLIGEFGSGMENGKWVGNFIRLYKNVGTADQPKFSGRWDYARPPFKYRSAANGTPYSVDQFCCIGFTPQFADLNLDGEPDMVTGQYQGEVTWFEKTQEGFLPGKNLPQIKDPRGDNFVEEQNYWLFSSASFADFTNDGLPDLITGGKSIRISQNIGTRSNPSFSYRDTVYSVNHLPLSIYRYTADELKAFEKNYKEYHLDLFLPPPGGDSKICPFVCDWDSDGLTDILATNSFSHSGLPIITFFKGVKSGSSQLFAEGQPLIRSPKNIKTFPGCAPRVFVTDWNNDGVNDLLVGVSVVMMNDKFSSQLSWNWEDSIGLLGPGKDPNSSDYLTGDESIAREKEKIAKKLPKGINIDEYMTSRHRGYVYLMLGRKK